MGNINDGENDGEQSRDAWECIPKSGGRFHQKLKKKKKKQREGERGGGEREEK